MDSVTDEPWDVPEGWVWTTLDRITERVTTIDPRRSLTDEAFDYVDLGAIGPTGVLEPTRLLGCDAPTRARQLISPGDTLYSCVRVYLGNIVFFASGIEKSVASTAFCVLRPAEQVEPRFLHHFVRSDRFRQWMIPLQRGNSPPAVVDSDVKSQPFPLPPLVEQRRIVARIDALFAEIVEGEAALTRARAGLDTFRRALLKAAVTGGLTREWREARHTEATGSDVVARLRSLFPAEGMTRGGWRPSDELDDLPSDWEWCAVSEAGEVQLGRQRAPQHHAGDHMRPYLRVANVLDDRLDLSDVKSMNFTPEEFRTFALRFGDILLNEGQAPDLLGRPAMYRDEIPGCCFQKTLLRFRAKPGILPEYALLVFRHYMHCGRFKRESRITTNIGHLTQVRFVAMEFPVPPTDEQVEVVRLFKEMSIDFDDVTSIRDAARLRQAVLKAAFEGRLVPQDPNDEPASAMLERLAQQNPLPRPTKRGRPRKI